MIKPLMVPSPPLGNQPSQREKNKINISPIQKLGIDTPISAKTVAKLSNTEYCLVADRIPRGIPMTMETSIPKKASVKVVGIRPLISVNTSFPVI